MNVFFQVALGLCPVVVALLVMTIISITKKNKDIKSNVLFLVGSIVMSVSCLVAGIVMSSSDRGLSTAKEEEINLNLAYAVASEGGYELASQMVDSLRKTTADSVDLTECTAYLEAAAGNPVTAKALFVKAHRNGKVDNYDEIIALCDKAIVESGTVADDGTTSTKETEKLQKYADKKIKEVAKERELDGMGKVLMQSEELYEDFLVNNNLDSSKASSLAKKIDSAFEKNPELKPVEELRVCRVKLLALANKYGDIAQGLDENAGFAELAIAAELYINDMIKEKSFSEDYGKDFVEIADSVGKQLDKVKDEIPAEEVKKLENIEHLIKNLSEAESRPALTRLKAELSRFANDESSNDRPKAFMQLARLEYEAGEDEASALYITSALNTVGVSDDANFYTPMIGIVDSITDKDDIEKVKNVAQYAQEVTNNSSDYVVVKSIESYISTGDYQPDTDKSDSEEEERSPFAAFLADTANQKRNAFSISSVDATNFKQVKVVLNVDPSISITPQELKKLISVKDCGIEITDYTVEKIEYKKANILLCCDVSGSMSGQPIRDLQNAVSTFAQTSSDAEDLALITFESSVSQVFPFGTSKQEIISAASNLYGGGGTDIYDAVVSSLNHFSRETDELNFVLLMSDGQSGKPNEEQMYNTVTSVCKDKNIVIYSLGLGGGVDTDHLNSYAAATGGYFVYVSDSATLSDFYSKLRSQILNRYIITYNAVDDLRANREVTISTKDSVDTGLLSDTKQYLMNGTDADVTQGTMDEDLFGFNGIVLNGLDTRRIIKSSKPVTVYLKGSDLTKDMNFSIKLDGKLDYPNITYEFVDASTLKLTLPGGMACGKYDLKITYQGKTAIFKDELTVAAKGSETTVNFGNYVFTADSCTESENLRVLSGNVTMNGWLHFNGDVSLEGNLENYSIRVTEYSGSYIRYDGVSSVGLAKVFANTGIVVPIMPLGSFNIYNDTYSDGESSSHKTDKIPVPLIYFTNFAEFKAPSIELYPNKIMVTTNGFDTKFPFQDKIVSSAQKEPIFKFDANANISLTNRQIGLKLDVSRNFDSNEKKTYSPVNFGNMPFYYSPSQFKVSIDTIKNEFAIDLGAKLAFVDGDGLSLSLEWSSRSDDKGLQRLAPSKVEFGTGDVLKVKAQMGPVPVTFSNFKIGVEDIDPNKSIWSWTLNGQFDVSTGTVAEVIPKLAKYIKEPIVLKLKNTTVSANFGDLYFKVETTAELLEAIEFASLKIEAGKIPYTNELLDMSNVTANGMLATLTAGFKWKTDNVDVSVTGTGILNLHSKFLGIEARGECNLEVSWWIFDKAFYNEGRVVVGFMPGDGGAFVIKSRETTSKGTKDIYVYINANGIDVGTKKL